MPRIKVARKSTAIDMTAMCDVAFLLLTFFILTATARQPEPLPVDTPASTVKFKLPDLDIATLTIGQKGKVFFGVPGQPIRKRTLELMGEKYQIQFTEEEKNLLAALAVEFFEKEDQRTNPRTPLKASSTTNWSNRLI